MPHEDRALSDVVKGTYRWRSERLRALAPTALGGDDTLTDTEYKSAYGILWNACAINCAIAGTEGEDRHKDWSDLLGPLDNGAPIILTGQEAIEARRRKHRWIINNRKAIHMAEGLPWLSRQVQAILVSPVSAAEREDAVSRLMFGDAPSGTDRSFQGDSAKVIDLESEVLP